MSEFTIGRRQLYILPTRIGWYFSLILISLFAIAVKFDNQSAFMMLFILASLGMMAMLYTHNNVIGLRIKTLPSIAVFVGETAKFPVQVVNQSNAERSAVWLLCAGHHQLLRIPANSQQSAEVLLPTIKRGYKVCDELNLSSQFPIGIFFCWSKRFQSSQRCLVYPRPLDLTPIPDDSSGGKRSNSLARNNNSNPEDYSGLKPYQEGDRLRDIHWPSLAKTQKLVSIQHESQASDAVNLSWFTMPTHLGVEDKLSQLCFWIQSAEHNNVKYQLEMPNQIIEFNIGLAHYHECLSVLALWGEQELI